MEGSYPILQGSESIGSAQIIRQGLYYCFDCHCNLSGEVVHRLIVTCGGNVHSLGILVPEGELFVLRTKLPVKKLGESMPQFRVQPAHKPMGTSFIPISPEEPFTYLSRVKDGFLEIREGVPGIVFPEETDEQKV